MLPYYKSITVSNYKDIADEVYSALPYIDPEWELISSKPQVRFTKMMSCDSSIDSVKHVLLKIPLLYSWLAKVDLIDKVLVVTRIAVPGLSKMAIHTDGNNSNPEQGIYGEAINFPVYNYRGSYTSWYKATPIILTKQEALQKLGSKYKSVYGDRQFSSMLNYLQTGQIFEEYSAEEICRYNFKDEAYWCNTSIPHSGHNESPNPRYLLSIRFKEKINLLELS